jgi:chromosome segregation ATPase
MVDEQNTPTKEDTLATQLEILHNKSAELISIESELLEATKQLSILKRQAKQTQALYEHAKQNVSKYAVRIKTIKKQVDETGKIVVGLRAKLTRLKQQP